MFKILVLVLDMMYEVWNNFQKNLCVKTCYSTLSWVNTVVCIVLAHYLGACYLQLLFFLQNLISKVEHVSGDVPQTSICTKILANIFLPGSLRVHGPPYKSSVQTEDGSVGTELREKLKRIGENKFFLNKKEEWG